MLDRSIKFDNLKEMMKNSEEKFGEEVAFYRDGKGLEDSKKVTYKEFCYEINSLGTALIEMGLKGKRIAIIGENRYEWELSYLAVVTGTGTIVPFDKALPENEIESLIIRSEVEAIIYSEKYDECMAKIQKQGNTKLKYFISMDLEKNDFNKYSLKEITKKGKELLDGGNKEFLEAIRNHKFIKDPFSYEEELLNNVEYYSSMIVFLNHKGESIPKDNILVLGHNSKIPEFNIKWFEILLNNVIILDRKNYELYENCISEIEKKFNSIGIIEKKVLSFTNNKVLEKYFTNSIGKLNSINEIVKIESDNLKEKLRMVILTDYIRKEYLNAENVEINKLGAMPIFCSIRKTHPGINLAILTGAMFIIPKSKEENLYGLCVAHGVDTAKLKFRD